jgi:hypothetical protein
MQNKTFTWLDLLAAALCGLLGTSILGHTKGPAPPGSDLSRESNPQPRPMSESELIHDMLHHD